MMNVIYGACLLVDFEKKDAGLFVLHITHADSANCDWQQLTRCIREVDWRQVHLSPERLQYRSSTKDVKNLMFLSHLG